MIRPVILALAVPLLLLRPAAAETIDPHQEYRACLLLAKQKPEDGWEEAIAWQSLGGGDPARHCAAVALIGLGKFEEAAKRLETLAEQSHREAALRAEMLAQASQSWVQAGRPDRALADLDTALGLVPGQPDLVLDKAVVLAGQGQTAPAIDLLTILLAAQPNRVEALTLRASAWRLAGRGDRAAADVERALNLDPAFPDAWLERGMLRRLDGDEAGARADWLRAIDLQPDGPAADTARRNIERMDVKVN